ncbi:hypothetical protein [Okeania sp.]|uniref:hypothetical protein n=1 Tax=Okeania sp. TaxID=3100323 RepID=UPI002B4B9586|nr:hypothetical protein [Okeania sp.]MEB3342980.1 hypothetical protein [Okeania sp.]
MRVISNLLATVPEKLENKILPSEKREKYGSVEGTVPEKLETKPLQFFNYTDTTRFDINPNYGWLKKSFG